MPDLYLCTRSFMALYSHSLGSTRPPGRITRSTHSFTFRQIQTTKNVYKYSFFPLTIVQGNRLPDSVVSLPDVDHFKLEMGKLNHLRP